MRRKPKVDEYKRGERFDLLMAIIRENLGSAIAREIQELYEIQKNGVYYARRDREDWKKKYDDLQLEVAAKDADGR